MSDHVVGPCLNKYRNYQIWLKDTKNVRDFNRVEFFPTKSRIPDTRQIDRLTQAIEDFNHELQRPDLTPTDIEYGKPFNVITRKLKSYFRPCLDSIKAAWPTFNSSKKDLHSPGVSKKTIEQTPRVAKKNDEQTPRVHTEQYASLEDARTRYKPGTMIQKSFNGKIFKGKIESYKKPYYQILYEDGDTEDMNHREISKFLLKPKPLSTTAKKKPHLPWVLQGIQLPQK